MKKEIFKNCHYYEDDPEMGRIHCANNAHGGGRGLCNSHYVKLAHHVKKGNKTWKDYEEMEMCRRPMTQDEKNINQMHPHRSYKKRDPGF